MARVIAVLAVLGWAPVGLAASPVEQSQMVELDRVRAEVAGEVQLAAYDLVDELVYGWTSEPPFPTTTPVVLAGVTVPVGLGTAMQALLENHIAAVLADNPTANVQLVHCPSCTAVVVHSGPEGTVVSRGIDNPKVLAELGTATGQHALFIDVEAEGTWLVLRARMTQLTPDLPIVWSHTLATSAATPPLLRQPNDLKSAADARQEYVDALRGRGPISVPLRFTVRTYARPLDNTGVPPPPFLWLQSGVELGTTEARAWTASILVGYSFVPTAYQGIMAQARVSRLLNGRSRSYTKPNLYGFVGAASISVWGPGTVSFRTDLPTADELITDAAGEGPRNSFGALQVGLDLRVGNRIGMSTFLETMPSFFNSDNIGRYVNIGDLDFQSFGTEVTFWF